VELDASKEASTNASRSLAGESEIAKSLRDALNDSEATSAALR
jgi:hypothetical protein